ncbi:MAG: MauE/DoxX family redox-associated membrane protein [Desulfatibacillaceae bacterium]
MNNSQVAPPEDKAGQKAAARAFSVILGLVLLISAIPKGLDLLEFAEAIKGYGIVTHHGFVVVAGWLVVILECALGAALVLFYRPRVSLGVALALFTGFSLLVAWAWHTGVECGCFGELMQRSARTAFFEDIVFVAMAGLALWFMRGKKHPPSSWKKWVILAALAGGVALPLASGFSIQWLNPPSGDLSAQQRDGQRVGDPLGEVPLAEVEADLHNGKWLVEIMGTGCVHCQEAVWDLNIIFQDVADVKVIGLCTDSAEDVEWFVNEFSPIFPIARTTDKAYNRLLGARPAPVYLYVEDGRILRRWTDVATAAEALLAPGGAPEQ